MVRVTGEQLQKASGYVRAEARRAPVEVTYHGRPELVVMSVEDYAVLRENRKLAMTNTQMPTALLARIASGRMDPRHDHLEELIDAYAPRARLIGELTDGEMTEISEARVPPEYDHLNKLFDD